MIKGLKWTSQNRLRNPFIKLEFKWEKKKKTQKNNSNFQRLYIEDDALVKDEGAVSLRHADL